MEPIIYLQWLAVWILFLLAQSVFINGIKTSSDGETEKLPDGTEKDGEMIFYPIAKLMDKHYMKRVYYKGEELAKLIEKLFYKFPFIPQNHTANSEYISFPSEESIHLIKQGQEHIERDYNLRLDIRERNVFFYKEYKEYMYSKWIRKPLIQCIKCMASIWSIPTFWIPIILIFGFHWWEILLWVADVVSLTWVNWFLYNRQK